MSRLGIVVPVKRIDEAARRALAAIAVAASDTEIVAVGQVASPPSAPPPANLAIVDRDCTLYQAMNEGLACAGADYLLFMGIDDRLLAENLPALRRELDAASSPLVVLPVMIGRRRLDQRPSGAAPRAYHHQGLLFEKRTASRLGGYTERYGLHSDLDLMLRMQRDTPASWIGLPLVEFRKGGATTSGEHALVSMAEFNRIYVEHGVSRLSGAFAFSIALLAWYRLRYLVRRWISGES